MFFIQSWNEFYYNTILINDHFAGIFFEAFLPLIGPHSIQFLNGPTAERVHSELRKPFAFSEMDRYNDIIHRVSFLTKNHSCLKMTLFFVFRLYH